jgi:carboxyl-terminal processing protease
MKFANVMAYCMMPVLVLLMGAQGTAQKPAGPSAQQLEQDYQKAWQFIADRYYDENALSNWLSWQHRYDGKLHSEMDLFQAVKDMTASLNDPWTLYRSPADLARKGSPVKGHVRAGFWILLDKTGAPYVELCEEGYPAYDSPIRAGDYILSVNGTPTSGMTADQVERLLAGTAGQSLTIDYRFGTTTATATVSLSAPQDVQAQARILPGGVLYAKLPEFNRESVDAFEAAIDKALSQPGPDPTKIVLDLRGNSGGFVVSVHYVASMFIEKGTLFTYTSRDGGSIDRDTKIVTNSPLLEQNLDAASAKRLRLLRSLPMVVLINHTTRSGGETLTAALKDNNRAKVFGEVSYGKSIVYDSFDQDFGGSLQVTIANISSPNGYSWQGKGLTPDVFVARPRTGTSTDVPLEAALQALQP